jgi:hypothetical protein
MDRKKSRAKQGASAKHGPSRRAEIKFLTERARLEQQAHRIIGWLGSRPLRKQLELGEILIQLKATCKHGEWEKYYEETFGQSCVSFRTAERYMKLAAKTKSDRLSVLKPGMDQHAVNIQNATKIARAETGVSDEQKLVPVYRLALHLTPTLREATVLLWASPHRSSAEKEVVAVLERFLVKHGFISSESLKSTQQEATTT